MTTSLTAEPLEAPPAPKRPRRISPVLLVCAVYIALTIYGCWWIGVSLEAVIAGAADIGRLVERMFPPTFGNPLEVARMLLETLLIAVAGTAIAAVLSVPLGAAASDRFTGPRVVQWLARAVIMVTRAIPSLVFALILVRVFGLGPTAGGLAIALHSVGMIGKMFADAFEEQDPLAADAVEAAGARRAQTFIATTLTRAMPRMAAIVLYRLDINVRASAVLGIVGAGGIGVALQTAIGTLNYRYAAGIIIVIVALLLVLEGVSVLVQRRLAEHAHEGDVAMLFSPGRNAWTPGWTRRRVIRAITVWGLIAVVAWSLWVIAPDPDRALRSLESTWRLLIGMFPPAFSPAVFAGLWESFLMAITATTFGVVIGLILAILSTDLVVRVPVVSTILRVVVVLVRGVPDLVWALLFVAALGLGPFPGFLALTISSTALAAKFFTDSLQNLDPLPMRALESAGAGRLQVFVAGVWPQFMPSFVGNGMFTSDLALRESAVLGVVGAGGIGFLLQESTRTLHYETTSAIVLGLLVIVLALEVGARWIRRAIL
ncbi:phosphonate ABC transporter, permease protein PhnE [Microbacterium sp.]|jgi:phosphonate transport system permease protein|uniref:phosphonate ABC transporter, permease protein PhnE n=1 Tax=Microbacterium sp. TaxID=51671 RepID=UPI002CFE2859|nr:phosphonate ABC transporter, permease protein PhnE [Microbacterium sp.]HWL76186.1 phosphonate ABC transporter, permease protein PhnE [Microbacterium sp.]